MADQSKELEIKITADDKASSVLKGVKNETAALSAGTAEQMGVATVSSKDMEKAIEGVGEKTKIGRYELRELATALGAQIPGAAALSRAGFESLSGAEGLVTGGVLLLISGVEMLRSAITKLNEEKKESAKLSEALAEVDKQTTKVIDAQREALEKADVEQARFFHDYLRNAHDAYAAETALYEQRMKASFEMANSEADTRKQIADKAVEELEQAGVLSHDRALKIKERLDLEYEARKLARQEAQNVATEGELARQQANKDIALHVDLGREQTAEQQYEGAAQAKAANDAKLADAQEKIAGAQKVIESLSGTGINAGTVEQVRQVYEQATGDKSGSKNLSEMFHELAQINLAGGGAISLSPSARAAHDIVSKLGSQGDVNLGLYEGAQLDIRAAQSDAKRARERQASLDIGEGNAKSDVEFYRQRAERDRDAAQDLGDKLESAQAINRINEAGGRTNFNLQAAARILEGHAQNIGDFLDQVNRLANSMSQMSPQAVADLARRVDMLEQQMENTGGLSFSR